MIMNRRSHILQRERKSPFRTLLDLYSLNPTFRGFGEFAVIGAIVLLFIHGFQSMSAIGDAARGAVSFPKLTDEDIKSQSDIAKLARRDNTMMPRLGELGLDERYFAGDPEPLRSLLTNAWRAYRSKASRDALQLLETADPGNPHVLLIRGLATMAQPENGSLRSGVLYLEQASSKGDVKSMAALGVLHIIGAPGIQQDLDKGQKLILAAAASGDVDASRVAGQGFLSGWMGSIDPGRAAKYFRFAADRNDPKAALYLSDLYFTGRGVPRDDLEADRLAEGSASQGNREAQAVVGLRRMKSYLAGITDDPSAALKWLELAAAQDEPVSMQALAMYHTASRSGQLDMPKAVELLKRCVQRTGNTDCAMSYASILDDGYGERDVKKIYAMYLLASHDGRHDKARSRMAELAKELSTADLLKIQADAGKQSLQTTVN
jgi:TPR repeat protein